MKAPVSWLREFVEAPADAPAIAARFGSCGFAVDGVEGDVIDLEITANRPDCLSVYGLAREVATAFRRPLAARPGTAVSGAARGAASPVKVSIADAGCGRYAIAAADVTVQPSPPWLADRLTAAGVRPINNIVDATNYVMLELGQPMHAFDLAKLAGPEIHVRRAREGERLVTLDGQTRALDPTMLVIADKDHAVAVAGVMGGAPSEVTAGTTRIVIESAWFLPSSVRATSKRLGLKTEASARFERGADPTLAVAALTRVLALLEQIGAGRPSSVVVDVYPRPAAPRRVTLDRGRLARLLGDTIPDDDVVRILSALGFGLSPAANGWQVEVPPFRVDVSREADLIEDVGRHWGFDRLPATIPPLGVAPEPPAPAVLRERRLRRVLCAAGLQEAVTFTFMEREAAAPFAADPARLVEIANPLSEKFAVLRPSLLPGLLDALIYNRRRESDSVRLFEIGSTFSPAGEASAAAWVLTGPRAEHWSGREGPADVFDAKGIAECVAAAFGAPIEVAAADDEPGLVPGRAARLISADDQRPVGAVGEIQPAIVRARGLGAGEPVVGGWIAVAALAGADARPHPLAPLPRHPSVVRDLSIVVDERLPAAGVRGTIRAHAPETLVAVREFDRYQGPGVPDGRVSLSVRLTFRAPDRTLTDGEVQRAVEGLVAALAREHGAVLR